MDAHLLARAGDDQTVAEGLEATPEHLAIDCLTRDQRLGAVAEADLAAFVQLDLVAQGELVRAHPARQEGGLDLAVDEALGPGDELHETARAGINDPGRL